MKNLFPRRHLPVSITFAGALCASLPSCTEGNTSEKIPAPEPPNTVLFTTSIAQTRAFDNVWERGDLIGVYMVPASGPTSKTATDWCDLEPGSIGANMRYAADLDDGQAQSENATFRGTDAANTLVWPSDGSRVDFVACYPYLSGGIEKYLYPIDIRVQNPQRRIDLMWSDNARSQNIDSGAAALSFSHCLTKLVFNVEDMDGASLEGMKTIISGLPSEADFDIAAGRIVADSVAGDADFEALLVSCADGDEEPDALCEQAVVEAIVLPGKALSYSIVFELEGGDTAVFKCENVTYAPGKRYIYNIRLEAPAKGVQFLDADGELSTITPWEDVVNDPDTIVKGPDPVGSIPPVITEWNSGVVTEKSDKYTITCSSAGKDISTGYQIPTNTTLTLSMAGFDGPIGSISVSVNGLGTISSVKVGDTALLYNGGPSAKIENLNNYLFSAGDKAVSGDVEIKLNSTGYVPLTLCEFRINPM